MKTIFNGFLCHPLQDRGVVAAEAVVPLANHPVLQWTKLQIPRARWRRGGRRGFVAQTFLQLPSEGDGGEPRSLGYDQHCREEAGLGC